MIIKTKMLTLNKYINAERSNKMIAANIKRKTTNSIALECIEEKPLKGMYDVEFIWYKANNREDHDNIAFCKKYILDGLKKAGIIKDDSPRHIRNFKDKFILDRDIDYLRCEVILKKVK